MKYLETEEFISLSSEEKKEYIRNLIHSEAAFHAAFLNPATGKVVEARELIEHLGEEKALDLIVRSIEDKATDTQAFTGEDIKKLIEKAQRGQCTKEELAMLNFIVDDIISKDENVHFEFDFMEFVLNIINHFQKAGNPKLSSMLFSCTNLILTSSMFDESGSLSEKYTPNDVSIVNEMCNCVSEDIYDTWKASCNSLPNPEIIIIALLKLATRIAGENNITFGKASDVANVLGISLEDDTENGSNEQNNCDISEE